MTEEISERLAPGVEVRGGVVSSYKWNLAEEDARAGFGDTVDFAQSSWNVFSRNDQQHIVANYD